MELSARLSYALIGFVFGALLGMLYWFVYGFRPHSFLGHLHLSMLDWVKYSGGAFAAIGFLFRENVGNVIGGLFNSFFDSNSDGSSGFTQIWGVLILALLFVLLFFYFNVSH